MQYHNTHLPVVGRENTENNSLAKINTSAASSDTWADCRPVPQRLELLGSSPHLFYTPTPEGFVPVETVNTYFLCSTAFYLKWACSKYKPSKKVILNIRAVLFCSPLPLLAKSYY